MTSQRLRLAGVEPGSHDEADLFIVEASAQAVHLNAAIALRYYEHGPVGCDGSRLDADAATCSFARS